VNDRIRALSAESDGEVNCLGSSVRRGAKFAGAEFAKYGFRDEDAVVGEREAGRARW